ncbi:DNA-binding PadR family transcriptional regulator [Actinoplanes lutulentus]|uniref:PadR family transcriptional regulator n=1 Tax=Actinoplanes lutulentus TaxID=1287878 RepID=A0A327Z113_9ACTN|nr:PadR family transcriptional regulator [Actinoplanes lutulentus]MBB2948938.1 DNA-binding PadR family transcriptional regulator [Actinoplanes lutulentus]RAK26279.1 PadR family transcriptional regulator [Actinoplanes lutulentus]
MAQRRKVNNLLGLHVMATLSIMPLHPYEIAAQMRARGKEQDLKIQWGSLYTVVQNLEKHGFIEAAETVREGRRPERTVYRITDAGRAEMTDWMRELVGHPQPEFPRLQTALSVIGVLPPDEAVDLLEQRRAILEVENEAQRASLRGAAHEVPRIFLIESEFQLAQRESEVAFVAALIKEIQDGSLGGIELWRHYHETGETPDFTDFTAPP